MSELRLPSLEIHNYRVFERLHIDRLARVNLITGKNNVGKSCLLEALRLYATRGNWTVVRYLLESRDEMPDTPDDSAAWIMALGNLFYGRESIAGTSKSMRIGPGGSEADLLTLVVGWYRVETDDQGGTKRVPVSAQDLPVTPDAAVGISIILGERPLGVFYPGRVPSRIVYERDVLGIPCKSVKAGGLDNDGMAQLWDAIALTDLEADVLAALRIICPEVERVNLIGSQGETDRYPREHPTERIPIVKVKDVKNPIPLRSLGEGMNRLFGVALALVNAREGLLLVDEIDSSLHYSVHPDLWRLVFRVARMLNVQVFATTHSWDCIEAFQGAVQENERDEGLLIRLVSKRGQVRADLFDERSLEIVTRERIEVR